MRIMRGVWFGVALAGALLIRYTWEPGLPAATRSTKGRQAADFVLSDSKGTSVRLSDYRGKVVLLNFWATWCGPCNIEIPWFIDFQKEYGGRGLAVVGVSVDDGGWNVVKPFVNAKRINYPVLLGSDQVKRLYGDIESIPTTLLIDREGKIAAMHAGLVSRSVYETEISRLLRN